MFEQFSVFADTIRLKKYAHDVKNNGSGTRKETWEETAERVATHVFRPVKAADYFVEEVKQAISRREFMPGGRYLSSVGREFHQTQNCLLLKAEDSREGWSQLAYNSMQALMTGAGIGVVYSGVRGERKLIRRTGGKATGPCALMQIINDAGRQIMQGGERRSAIWAGLHWWHDDIMKFIRIKDWAPEVRALKAKDFAFPATLDGTNISVILDDEFFVAYHDETHPRHSLANMVYWTTIRQMISTAEPGFSIDVGVNAGENLRNAPVCAETKVLVRQDGATKYVPVSEIIDRDSIVWTGFRWAFTTFRKTASSVPTVTVKMSNGKSIHCDPTHPFITHSGKIEAAKLVKGIRLNVRLPEGKSEPISVVEIEPDSGLADVFCCDVQFNEHSFCAEGVLISNCTEVSSRDDSDICNLGSINMAKVTSLDHMTHLVNQGTAFLLAGTVYSHVPYSRVDQIRSKNRRLGLGLMGLHEWLLVRGKKYGPDAELEKYLKVYAKSTEIAADYADMWDLSHPVKTRAIAPTGTIGIVAMTTTGIEPIFCVAYKRRYLRGRDVFNFQYVVDPTAKRLIEQGVDPSLIEDAYSIDVDRRIEFQAWVQQYVDHGISSTINLPPWGSERNCEATVTSFGETLIRHLPKLRGLTCYPDGARDGQPLTAVPYLEAVASEGLTFEEAGDVCKIRGAGSCGD